MTVAQEISHWQVMSGQMDLQVDPSRNSDLQTLKTITNFSHFDQLVLVVQNLKLVKDFFCRSDNLPTKLHDWALSVQAHFSQDENLFLAIFNINLNLELHESPFDQSFKVSVMCNSTDFV